MPVTGTVVFEPGETTVAISVIIIDDKRFESTTEFNLSLSDPENCELGQSLQHCRVAIIDDDIFPSNKYARDLLSNPRNIYGLGLLWEYVKFNFRDKIVRTASIKWFISDIGDNVYYIWCLFLMRYLVDTGGAAMARSQGGGCGGSAGIDDSDNNDDSATASEGDSGFEGGGNDSGRRLLRAVVRRLATDEEFMLTFVSISAGLAVPLLFMHYIDYRKNFWKIGGTARKLLQERLLQKFLYYKDRVKIENVANSKGEGIEDRRKC